MAAAATTTVEVSDDGDHPVLRDDERGIPRSLSLLAAIVEADAARHAAAATRPAESDLVTGGWKRRGKAGRSWSWIG
uniref:Uncharacterized protein n=1 Tax=Oryza barthii TaxID=65489 RepID=A0A0D3GNV8_9ORYZ